jgi:argininosuccinate lyase
MQKKLARRAAALMLALAAPAIVATQAAAQAHDQFYWLSEMNKASAVMVVEQKIVPPALGGRIAASVAQAIADGDKPGAARSGDYLKVEQDLIKAGGPDVTRLHSGRSRQDINATMARLALRESLLDAFDKLAGARAVLLAMAGRYPNAIMPAYTWGVQAQPVSFGHYILAYGEALDRTAERLRQAYARLNQSPLGGAALGTSSFPVNRPRLAELLGFDGVVENSLDATQIAHIDMGAELVGVASAGALTVGTMLADITAQYSQTQPWLLLAEGDMTGGSSIMPQKRNPTGIVFLRTQASTLLGHAQTFLIVAHNLQAGMSDYKPFIGTKQGEQPDNVVRELAGLFGGFSALLKTLVFNEQRALAEVNNDYSTTTELADTLQRVADVPFRVGHHFASDLVTFGRSRNLKPAEIPYDDAKRIYIEAAKLFRLDNAQLPLTEAQFRTSLTAENMVNASQGLGGPQPAEVVRMLADGKTRLAADRDWLAGTNGKLQAASRKLDDAFARLRTN